MSDNSLISLSLYSLTIFGLSLLFSGLFAFILFSIAKGKIETKYRKMIEFAPFGIFILDRHGLIIDVNDQASVNLKYSKKELIGKKSRDLLSPEDEFKSMLHFNKVKENPGKIFTEEFCFKQSTGNLISGEIHAIQIEPDLNLGILVNNTERKKMQQQQTEIQKQMIISGKLAAIGELSAGIAHEINNPLAIIKGHVEIMEEICKKNPIKDHCKNIDLFNVIYRSISRIKNIVNGLSNYSRSDSDEIEVLDLKKIIEETINFIGNLYQKSNINITKDIRTEQSLLFIGNKGKFQQVILNILNNCKDALEKQNSSNKHIAFELDLIDQEHPSIGLSISDNGAGIKQEHLNKIFMPFFTTKAIGKGTGLGLATSKQIIENIKGNIRIESEEGQGTSVILQLPLHQQFDLKLNDKLPKEEDFSKKNRRVLIVDDEVDICKVIANIFQELNFETIMVHNGKDALNKINEIHQANQSIDILATDIYMPEMDGLELIKHLRKNNLFQGKILLISSSNHKSSWFFTKDSCDGYLTKPFSREDVLRHVKRFSAINKS